MSAKTKRAKRRKDERHLKLVLVRTNAILDIILEEKYESVEEMTKVITDFRDKSNKFIQTL